MKKKKIKYKLKIEIRYDYDDDLDDGLVEHDWFRCGYKFVDSMYLQTILDMNKHQWIHDIHNTYVQHHMNTVHTIKMLMIMMMMSNDRNHI